MKPSRRALAVIVATLAASTIAPSFGLFISRLGVVAVHSDGSRRLAMASRTRLHESPTRPPMEGVCSRQPRQLLPAPGREPDPHQRPAWRPGGFPTHIKRRAAGEKAPAPGPGRRGEQPPSGARRSSADPPRPRPIGRDPAADWAGRRRHPRRQPPDHHEHRPRGQAPDPAPPPPRPSWKRGTADSGGGAGGRTGPRTCPRVPRPGQDQAGVRSTAVLAGVGSDGWTNGRSPR